MIEFIGSACGNGCSALILHLVDDPRIKQLRSLVKQAIELRDSAEQLIIELSGHLHDESSTSDDRGVSSRMERRLKQRS